MDPELAALAGTAGTTVVMLMATDAWERTRDAVGTLWRRAQPGREESIRAELEATHEDVVAAREAGDGTTEAELGSEWQGRLRRLLAAHPEVADELRDLLREFAPAEEERAPVVRQQARASGRARIYQAGRDQHISER